MTETTLLNLDLARFEASYNLNGMKKIFQEIAEFIKEANDAGYMLPEWKPDIIIK